MMQKILDSAKQTGALQLINRDMNEFPDELYDAETVQCNVKFYEANPITKLIVKGTPIKALNWERLKELFDLEAICLQNCKMTEFLADSDKLT